MPRTLSWSDLIRSPKASRMLWAMSCKGSEPGSSMAVSLRARSSAMDRSGSVVRGFSSPTGIGLSERSGWLNTPTRVSERILYLPSLIEEMEYITTKKANSRVMKSA
ncbi:hypothetical protein FQZ97_1113260 [compost metagenome]